MIPAEFFAFRIFINIHSFSGDVIFGGDSTLNDTTFLLEFFSAYPSLEDCMFELPNGERYAPSGVLVDGTR